MSKKVVVNSLYFMSIVNNVILCVTSYYVKKGRGKWFLFYFNTAQNNKPAVDGTLILSLLPPSSVVLRSVTVAANCELQFEDVLEDFSR